MTITPITRDLNEYLNMVKIRFRYLEFMINTNQNVYESYQFLHELVLELRNASESPSTTKKDKETIADYLEIIRNMF